MDAFVDAAKMAMNETSPTPIMSADAVAAVRRGFRVAFSRARLPLTPRSLAMGQPMKRLNGSAIVRPRTVTAEKITNAPAPTIARAELPPLVSPYSSAPPPTTRRATPTTARFRDP